MSYGWSEITRNTRRAMALSDRDTGLTVAEVDQDADCQAATVTVYPPLSQVAAFSHEDPPVLGVRYSSIGHAMNAVEAYVKWWETRR